MLGWLASLEHVNSRPGYPERYPTEMNANGSVGGGKSYSVTESRSYLYNPGITHE